jgi:hypothetical protein
MSEATSQLLARYYEKYSAYEITFTTEVVQTLNLDPRQVYIKCINSQWPCIINSASLSMARVIIGTKSGAFSLLQNEKGVVSLRFGFLKHQDLPINFFVSARVTDISPYNDSDELVIVALTFTQRPPDDLIEILGQYADADAHDDHKKNERIPITPDTVRKLGLSSDEVFIVLDGESQRCMLRDLAFDGARVLILGVHGKLTTKNVLIRLEFDDLEKPINLPGVITEMSLVEGDNMAIAVLHYQESMIPMTYKIRINNYLSRAHRSSVQTAGDSTSPMFSATDTLVQSEAESAALSGAISG